MCEFNQAISLQPVIYHNIYSFSTITDILFRDTDNIIYDSSRISFLRPGKVLEKTENDGVIRRQRGSRWAEKWGGARSVYPAL